MQVLWSESLSSLSLYYTAGLEVEGKEVGEGNAIIEKLVPFSALHLSQKT